MANKNKIFPVVVSAMAHIDVSDHINPEQSRGKCHCVRACVRLCVCKREREHSLTQVTLRGCMKLHSEEDQRAWI